MSPLTEHYVNFRSDTGNVSITVLLGKNTAVMTGGYTAWETVDRPKRKSLTRYVGKQPYRMDVPVLFDGFSDGESQEFDIANFRMMTEPANPKSMPPKIHVSGAVPRDDILWVIEDITWETDDVIWDVIGGTSVRLRQSATVHLLEFVDDDVIVTAPSPAVVAGGGKKSTTKPGAGKTAKQLAQEAYSNPGFWQTIIGANPWLSPDPRVPIPPNKTVVIPPSPKTK